MEWMSALVAAGSLIAGWSLNELSKRFQLSRERRAIVGRALSSLLALHHRVRVIESNTEYFTQQLALPEAGRKAYKLSFEYMLPQGNEFVTRYEEAIDQLAEIDPVTAFELRSKAVIPRLLSGISTMVTMKGISAEEVAAIEKLMKATLLPALEKAILKLARSHGRITKWRVEVLLNSTLAVPPELHQYLQNAQAENASRSAGEKPEN